MIQTPDLQINTECLVNKTKIANLNLTWLFYYKNKILVKNVMHQLK